MQFPDKVIAMPVVFTTGAVSGRVVDTPVVFNDRGHGPDGAVPGQGYCYVRCLTTGAVPRLVVTRLLCSTTGVMILTACCFYDSCTLVQTLRNVWRCPHMQTCLVVDVSVTMQRLCGVDGDGVLWFSSAFYGNFRAPLWS